VLPPAGLLFDQPVMRRTRYGYCSQCALPGAGCPCFHEIKRRPGARRNRPPVTIGTRAATGPVKGKEDNHEYVN